MNQKIYPSVKRISDYLRIEREQAALVRQAMQGIDLDNLIDNKLPNTAKWINSCYNMPSKHEIKMAALNELIGGYGVEVVGDVSNYPVRIDMEYVNMGDTYNATICYFRGRYILSTWGDIVEKHNLGN